MADFNVRKYMGGGILFVIPKFLGICSYLTDKWSDASEDAGMGGEAHGRISVQKV